MKKIKRRLAGHSRSFTLMMGVVALILLAYLAFHRVLNFGFIWDDDYHVTANPCVVGPWGFKEIWTTTNANFFPLVLSTFLGEFLLWGPNPCLFHLVNLLFHTISALMLWRVLSELKIPYAWLGALLWCVHPVQMESAAWVSEQKNTESAALYLFSVLLFLRSMDSHGRWRAFYAGSLLCAGLALTAKTSTVVLPLVLLLCCWWRGEKLSGPLLLRMIPFLLLSAIAGVLTVLEQKYHVGATGHEYTLDCAQRIALIGITPWFYLGKLLWPASVLFIYPKWTASELIPLGWILLAMNALLLGVLWHLRRSTTWARPILFAWTYFLIALIPVAGLFDGYFFRYSYVSDHFQYLAAMGITAFVGAAIARIPRLHLSIALAVALIVLLVWMDWSKSDRFSDSRALWLDTVAGNPSCWMALINLGIISHHEGRIPQAESFFQSALQLHPKSLEALNDLGVIKLQGNDLHGAKELFEKALGIQPKESKTLCNLAEVARREGKVDEAVGYYEHAIQANDLNADAKCSLATLLQSEGKSDQAESLLRDACRKSPLAPHPHAILASLLASRGDLSGAIQEDEACLSLNPESNPTRGDLALLELRSGRLSEARENLRLILNDDPHTTDAIMNLALLDLQQGRLAEALQGFRSLLEITPHDIDARNSSAEVLLRMGDVGGAEACYRQSLGIVREQPETLRNLAVMVAGSGRKGEAIALASEARTLASKQRKNSLHDLLDRDLKSYQSGKKVEIRLNPPSGQ